MNASNKHLKERIFAGHEHWWSYSDAYTRLRVLLLWELDAAMFAFHGVELAL